MHGDSLASSADLELYASAAPLGAVRALGGVDGAALAQHFAAAGPREYGRRPLIVTLRPTATAAGVVDQIADALAEAARRLWPFWWGRVRFHQGRDTLARLATGLAARRAAREIAGVSAAWAEAAARLAAEDRAPRILGAELGREVFELARVVGGDGLTLYTDAGSSADWPHPEALARALEATAARINGVVVALFRTLPGNAAPFDRILYDAHELRLGAAQPTPAPEPLAWIGPARGEPHPMSSVEQRLARALVADPELAPLFVFNRRVRTANGGTPRVDLIWVQGRLVVEIDGFACHGNRRAFVQDRHRDYELLISGYAVLRLTNDEIDEDLEKAIEKIRDVAAFCRRRLEG